MNLDARERHLHDKLGERREIDQPEMVREVNRIDRAGEHHPEVPGHRPRIAAVQDAGEDVQPIVVRLRRRLTSRPFLVVAPLCVDQRALASDLGIAVLSKSPLEPVPRICHLELVPLVVQQSAPTRCHLGREVSPDGGNKWNPRHPGHEVSALGDLAQRGEVESFRAPQRTPQQVLQVVDTRRLHGLSSHHFGMTGNDIMPLYLVRIATCQR